MNIIPRLVAEFMNISMEREHILCPRRLLPQLTASRSVDSGFARASLTLRVQVAQPPTHWHTHHPVKLLPALPKRMRTWYAMRAGDGLGCRPGRSRTGRVLPCLITSSSGHVLASVWSRPDPARCRSRTGSLSVTDAPLPPPGRSPAASPSSTTPSSSARATGVRRGRGGGGGAAASCRRA